MVNNVSYSLIAAVLLKELFTIKRPIVGLVNYFQLSRSSSESRSIFGTKIIAVKLLTIISLPMKKQNATEQDINSPAQLSMS